MRGPRLGKVNAQSAFTLEHGRTLSEPRKVVTVKDEVEVRFRVLVGEAE